jgi:hypothetical protein
MAKKRSVRPFYTKAMQRLEQFVRNQPDVKHARDALDMIEGVRREAQVAHAKRHRA